MKYRILNIDDDISNLDSTRMLLEDAGFIVATSLSGKEGIKTYNRHKYSFAVVIVDFRMPEMNGAVTVKRLLASNPRQQIIMYSADGSREALKDSWQAGAVDFIEKDIEVDLFIEKIKSACSKYENTSRLIKKDVDIKSENEKLIESVGMIGCSNGLAEVANKILKYANEKQGVLIQGETGTGKECVARALHNFSDRKCNQLVTVNCAAIPENLLESALFGHERGAFTGADKKQIGKFMLANGGSIFLDEIGDLSLKLQVKLLRVLQEKTVEPVGSNNPQKVDVRVLAATHRDLCKMVKEGSFREDLYYRLNVLSIDIPPIRQRVEDIEPLIAHFTDEICKQNNINKHFQRLTLSVLENYRWPGNVREIQNVVAGHLIKCPDEIVTKDHLDGSLYKKANKRKKVAEKMILSELDEKQKDEKRNYIISVLRKTKNQADAARMLCISPSKLFYYIENYRLQEISNEFNITD